MAIVVSILCVAILTVIFYALIKFIKLRLLFDKIPGPYANLIFGNTLELKRDSCSFWEQLTGCLMIYDDFPKMMRFFMVCFPYLLVFGPDEAEVLLSSNKELDKSYDYTLVRPWMGLGLLTSYAERWRPRRKLLTPTFHYDILKDFVEVFDQQARILVQKLEQSAGTFIELYPYITHCTLDIICQSAMGRHVNAQRDEESEYVKSIYSLNCIIHERQRKPWFWIDFVFRLFGPGKEHDRCLNIVHSFTKKVMAERYEELKALKEENVDKPESKRRLAFLDLLLEMMDNGQLTMQDVREEVDTFMFEGHDTTTAGMNWLLFLLGNYPECQKKVHQELDQLFGDDDEREITYEDLKHLNYLEMCIKEALRLYPSVPIFARQLREDCSVVGYTIPARTTVMFIPSVVHRNPKHWPDPDQFDPDRFLPENTVGRHPYAYLPFSAGSRNCIGQRFALMEEKTVLAWILRKFSVKSKQRRDQVRAKAEFVLRPLNSIYVEFKVRKGNK